MGFGSKLGAFSQGAVAGYGLGRKIMSDIDEDNLRKELRQAQTEAPREDVDVKFSGGADPKGMVYDQDTGTMVPSVLNPDEAASDRFAAVRGVDQNIMPENEKTVSKRYSLFGKTSDTPFTDEQVSAARLGARADIYRKFGRDAEADKLEADALLRKNAGMQGELNALKLDEARRGAALPGELEQIEKRNRDFRGFIAGGGSEGYIERVNADRQREGLPALSEEEAAGVKRSLGAWDSPVAKYAYDQDRISAHLRAGDTKTAEQIIKTAEARAGMDFLGALARGDDKTATALYNLYPNGHTIDNISRNGDNAVITQDGRTSTISMNDLARLTLDRIDPDAAVKANSTLYGEIQKLLAKESLPSTEAQADYVVANTEYVRAKTETESTVKRELERAKGRGRIALSPADNNGIFGEAKAALTKDGVVDSARLAPITAIAQNIYGQALAAGQNISYGQAVMSALDASKNAEFSKESATARAKTEAEALNEKFGRKAFKEYGGREKFEAALADRYEKAGVALTHGREEQTPRTARAAPPDQLKILRDRLSDTNVSQEDRNALIEAFKRQFPASAGEADKIASPAAKQPSAPPKSLMEEYLGDNPNGEVRIGKYGSVRYSGAPQSALNALKAAVEKADEAGDGKAIESMLAEFGQKYPSFAVEDINETLRKQKRGLF